MLRINLERLRSKAQNSGLRHSWLLNDGRFRDNVIFCSVIEKNKRRVIPIMHEDEKVIMERKSFARKVYVANKIANIGTILMVSTPLYILGDQLFRTPLNEYYEFFHDVGIVWGGILAFGSGIFCQGVGLATSKGLIRKGEFDFSSNFNKINNLLLPNSGNKHQLHSHKVFPLNHGFYYSSHEWNDLVGDENQWLSHIQPSSSISNLHISTVDTATSDTATSDTATSDTATSDTSKPNSATSDTSKPNSATSDTSKPDTSKLDPATSDTSKLDDVTYKIIETNIEI